MQRSLKPDKEKVREIRIGNRIIIRGMSEASVGGLVRKRMRGGVVRLNLTY